jgi:ribulose-phosphate 3-epimerase
MTVIPVINANTFTEAREQFEKVKEFAEWIHIDVVDGKFAPRITWGSPEEAAQLMSSNKQKKVKIEVHLMVENPELVIGSWIDAGAQRIIVHVEAMNDAEVISDTCHERGVELMLAAVPETPVEELLSNSNEFKEFQILAVSSGPAGQPFQSRVLEKVRILREKFPHAIIEVDGGMNPETAELVKEAGANIVVSASYILSATDSRKAYTDLVVL